MCQGIPFDNFVTVEYDVSKMNMERLMCEIKLGSKSHTYNVITGL